MVKQALAELDGVRLVEDEWERGLESENKFGLDLLFVEYEPDKITLEALTKSVKQQGFIAEVKKEN